jgi:5-methylcytosine-specific restriction endonuclease McrA
MGRKNFRLPHEPEYDQQGRRLRLLVDLSMKTRLCEAQNWRCCGCGTMLEVIGDDGRYVVATLEHVVPFSKGGADDESNFVITCVKCNQSGAVNVM